MRTLLFAALLSGGLCAQTPLDDLIEPASAPQAASPLQTPDAAQPEQNRGVKGRIVVSPSTSVLVTADSSGDRASPVFLTAMLGRAKVALDQACSVPLVNLAPGGGVKADSRSVIPRLKTLGNIDHMPVTQGAPPCAPAKR